MDLQHQLDQQQARPPGGGFTEVAVILIITIPAIHPLTQCQVVEPGAA